MLNTPNHPNAIRYQETYDSYGSSPTTIYSPMYRSHPIYPTVQFARYYGEPHSIEEDSVDKGAQFLEQQRRIQFLEEELNRKKETILGLQSQISKYEQEKQAEKKKQSRYWTPEEHTRFLEALSKYGHKDVKSIANYVSTRNPTQVRTHAQKYFLRIDKERQKKIDNKDTDRGGLGSDKDDIYKLESGNSDSYDDGSPLFSSCTNSPTSHHSNSNPFPNSNGSTPNGNINTNLNNNVNGNHSSPVLKRKREAVTITASQAKNALLYKDAVLAVLPISWTPFDYDNFSRGLLSHIDQDDIHNLCKMIKESFLQLQSIESIEAAYHAFHRAVQQKANKDNINNSNNNTQNNNNNMNNFNSSNSNISNSNSNSSNNLDVNRSSLKKRPPPVNVPRSEYPVTQLNQSSNSPQSQSSSPNISSSQSSSPIYLQHQHQYPLPPPQTPNYSGISTPIGIIHPISPSLPSAPSMRWPLLYETYAVRKGSGMEQHIPISPQTPQGNIQYGIQIHHGMNSATGSNGGSNNSSFIEVHDGHDNHSNTWSSPPPPFSGTNNSNDSPNWNVNQTINAFSNTTLNNNSSNNGSHHSD